MELAHLAAGIGAGITVFGAGIGIGRLAAAALEAGARQPEAIGDTRTTMIIASRSYRRRCFVCLRYLYAFGY